MPFTSQRVIASLALIVSLTTCTPKGPSPQQRFDGLYRACRALQGATSTGVSYARFGELLQQLATELLIAGDHASSDDEKTMVTAYAEVATIYKDSATVWKHQIESAKYEWAKGQIFQEPDLVPITAKYSLPTTQQTLVAGRSWIALPEDSIQRVWLKADESAEKARRLYFGLGQNKK